MTFIQQDDLIKEEFKIELKNFFRDYGKELTESKFTEVKDDEVIFNNGLPIQPDKKLSKIRASFNIPENTEIYLVHTASVFSIFGKDKGFAITEDGIYYRDDDKKVGIYPWDEFADCYAITHMGFLQIKSPKGISHSTEFNIKRAKVYSGCLGILAEIAKKYVGSAE